MKGVSEAIAYAALQVDNTEESITLSAFTGDTPYYGDVSFMVSTERYPVYYTYADDGTLVPMTSIGSYGGLLTLKVKELTFSQCVKNLCTLYIGFTLP